MNDRKLKNPVQFILAIAVFPCIFFAVAMGCFLFPPILIVIAVPLFVLACAIAKGLIHRHGDAGGSKPGAVAEFREMRDKGELSQDEFVAISRQQRR
jgi:uncharacterized membrane protein